jgi:Ca2+-binding RTX toxin-like protein
VENLRLSGTSNLLGTGNSLSNQIIGNTGNNLLQGLDGDDLLKGELGNDTMEGGLGNDIYYVDNALDVVTEASGAGTGTDVVYAILSATSVTPYTLPTNVENVVYFDPNVLFIVGNALNNYFTGNDGDNTLDGAGGADTMEGGAGNDYYIVENAGDSVVENSSEGTDTVKASVSFTLGGEIENLVLNPGGANLNGTGNSLGNDIDGNNGANVLNGGAGSDTMSGGAGNDTYVVDTASDVIDETGGSGIDKVVTTANLDLTTVGGVENVDLAGLDNLNITGNGLGNVITGNGGNNVINGGGGVDTASYEGASGGVNANLDTGQSNGAGGVDTLLNVENLTGSGYGDELQGSEGDNVLDGSEGQDTMAGDAGNDTYYVDDLLDVVVELNNTPAAGLPLGTDIGLYAGVSDTVSATVNFTLGNFLENLVQTGVAGLTGVGNALRNALTGNDGANLLQGLGDIDTLAGGLGNDTLEGGDGDDSLTGGAGADSLLGGAGGADTAVFVGNRALYSASFNSGTGFYTLVSTAEGTDLVSGVELFEFADLTVAAGALLGGGGAGLSYPGSEGPDSLVGGSGDDTLTGLGGNDTLDGGPGVDIMEGGDGADLYYLGQNGDLVIETNELAAGGNDTVLTYYSGYILTANVENGRIMFAGTGGVSGNTGNNILYAAAGNNNITGGLGQDTASYLYATSAITANLSTAGAQDTGGSGSDTFVGIENLTGSAFNDTLLGNTAANILDGGAGTDAMTGGDGADTYLVRDATDSVSETNPALAGGIDLVWSYLANYTLGTNVENGRIMATGVADITGNTLNNVLYAGVGNNILTADTGTDTISYAYMGAGVTASLATGTATGGSGADSFTGFENLTGSNFNDSLTGDAGANILDGGLGVDTMVGGDGNDTYLIRNGGDTANEASAAGGDNDIALVYYGGYTLTANVENGRIMAYTAANINGNALNNLLIAGINNNVINGAAGTDTVSYLFASAAVDASLATGLASGGSGDDGFTSIENLTGSSFNDALAGDANNNTITGGTGADSLTGGAGSDTFDYNSEAESGITNTTWDRIEDFLSGQGDKIDLSGIDANIAVVGNQGFAAPTSGAAFSAASTFTAAGQLFYDTTADVLYGNTDADSAAEFAVNLAGVASVVTSDFIL